MQVSPAGINLTETSEGCRLKAYQDTGGVWTIGYGHTGGVVPNAVITQEQAEALLRLDLQYAQNCVNSHALPCTQGQFDALTDFVFNVGPSQFLTSHLLRYHLAGQYDLAAAEFPKWKFDNGKVISGLVTRRQKERLLYSLQEPVSDRPQTDEPAHSAAPVVYSAPVSSGPIGSQPLPAQPAQPQQTAAASSSTQFGFGAALVAALNSLLGRNKP